ncbi:recombinase family protein [Avrilella dinanensis]|uniref:Recombinase family protein n=1 Tax=Avrilella dinanensis TaxID=2008672 RepID=A0A2M9R880_9FLAO|nr:recombinase family protein [Avrilella dinanensis]PJR05054.1 recombinase family protein [Avrilella dinanensis]
MKIADLYVRVSTDEQADKGYSQRDQEERLRRYCSSHNIRVGQIIYEDHSAKSFNRPEWVKLLTSLKKKSSKTNLVLFTKWDRFSRNAGDAYQMINTLTKLGVDPQAVEQPLDLSIPENKMMLAIYLAAPEVENDRRALNTFYGMRRAKKEGRVMGNAPFGYINRSREDGSKYIAIKEPEASTMRLAFDEIAKGIYAPDQIRQKISRAGKKIVSRNAFHVAVRNPVYCGKVFIPKYGDEEATIVKGQHEALISEELFDKVQQILDGNKRQSVYNTKVLSDVNLPLRGYLVCPECGRNLTGSASKGRNTRYYYYHCIASCGFRQRAKKANQIFEEGLIQFGLNEGNKDILKKMVLLNYNQFIKENPQMDKRRIAKEIDKLNEKLSVAREKLLSNIMDDDEYLELKKEYKQKIEKLEEQLSKNNTSNPSEQDIQRKLNKALDIVQNISSLYTNGDIEKKRTLIGSIFPEKLEFDGTQYRTARINSVFARIFQINNELHKNKNRKNDHFNHFSCLVPEAGIEPALRRTRV